MHRKKLLLPTLLILSLLSLGLSLSFGSVNLKEQAILQALWHQGSSLNQTIIWQLRLPRCINAYVVGSLLALTGALMQALLRNPLADPYILGISGGSAIAGLLAMLIGIVGLGFNVATFLGGLAAMLIVLGLNCRRHHWNSTRLLLTGIIVAAGCMAATTLILSLSPDQVLRDMMFWLIGEIYTAPLSRYGIIILVLGFVVSFAYARPLDLLSYGEHKASSLGVNTKRLYLILYLVSALLTTTAVSIAGPIGFIGLITPHLLRLLGYYQHRYLLPGCLLLGGCLLSLADTLARTVAAPQQLPVGTLTILLGVPIFLLLLSRVKQPC